MNDNRRDKITNGRNGDHVSIIDPNCQRRVLDRSCDFHAIEIGQEQETPMLDDKSHTSAKMPANGTPPRFTEFSVWKPSTRLNSSCICAVVDHVRRASAVPRLSLIVVGHVQTESAVPHLSLTPAERAATTTRILKFRISEFRISEFRISEKSGKCLF